MKYIDLIKHQNKLNILDHSISIFLLLYLQINLEDIKKYILRSLLYIHPLYRHITFMDSLYNFKHNLYIVILMSDKINNLFHITHINEFIRFRKNLEDRLTDTGH
jgi:hypothetical protein